MKIKKYVIIGLFLLLSSLFVISGDVIVQEGKLDVSQNLEVTGDIYTSGSVGIGTTSPGGKLEVRDTTTAIVAKFSGGDVNGVELDLKADTSGGNEFKIGVSDSSHPWGEGFYIYDTPATTNRFFIDGSGNVGIGTTSPNAKLDVEGSLEASSVTSLGGVCWMRDSEYSNWPDCPSGAHYAGGITRSGSMEVSTRENTNWHSADYIWWCCK